MHRKSANRKFKALQMRDSCFPEKRGRKTYYTPDSIAALKTVWEASSEICGELLHPVISDYVKIFIRDKMWNHAKEATNKLLEMSEGTVKIKIGKFRKVGKRQKGKSATKPSQLKEIIPIFTGPWDGKGPGYGQIDTVVHCGHSLSGNMAFSVNYTDVATLWIVLCAQWNKGEIETQRSLERIRSKTPFRILGMHPDTGSEFINWNLKRWCDKERIELTRSRPYHKNDNAYVEQKNGHVIRRFLGYSRIDNIKAVSKMNDLYNILGLYLNYFVPSRKCIEKVRIGSRYRKKYDKAKTPCKRVLAHPDVDQDVKTRLMQKHGKLNPLILKKKVDRLIGEVFKIQKGLR